VLVGWKGRGTAHILLPKEDAAALQSLVNITSPGSLNVKNQESKFDRKDRIRQDIEKPNEEEKVEEAKEEEVKVEPTEEVSK
jgi:hypothetical protein